MIKQPIHIAFADDQISVRKGIVALINNFGGMQVDIESGNGKDLIRQIEKAKTIPDLCLLDINMPDMNGFDAIVEIKRKWPEIKVLVFTVFDIETYMIRMIMYGANGYLLKKCDPDELKNAILSIHHNGMYYSEKITHQFILAIQNKETILSNLTARELQVLKFCCTELHFAQIAKKIGTTKRSVDGLRDSLFKKLHVNSRISLAMYAVQVGLVTIEINTSKDKLLTNKK